MDEFELKSLLIYSYYKVAFYHNLYFKKFLLIILFLLLIHCTSDSYIFSAFTISSTAFYSSISL